MTKKPMSDNMRMAAIWMTTFAAGFLLRAAMARGDDYLGAAMMLGASLIFTFGKKK